MVATKLSFSLPHINPTAFRFPLIPINPTVCWETTRTRMRRRRTSLGRDHSRRGEAPSRTSKISKQQNPASPMKHDLQIKFSIQSFTLPFRPGCWRTQRRPPARAGSCPAAAASWRRLGRPERPSSGTSRSRGRRCRGRGIG